MSVSRVFQLLCMLFILSACQQMTTESHNGHLPDTVHQLAEPEISGRQIEFTPDFQICRSPQASETERYAILILKDDLTRRFKGKVSFSDSSMGSSRTLKIIAGSVDFVLPLLNDVGLKKKVSEKLPPHPESYLITVCETENGPLAVVIGSDDSGILYGCNTLQQLIKLKDTSLSLPELTVADWPTLTTRAYASFKEDSGTLDLFARWRLNTMYTDKFTTDSDIQHQIKECKKRGIDLYGCVRYRDICTLEKEFHHIIRNEFEQWARNGCRGLIFMCDDLPYSSREHPYSCPRCKKKWGMLPRSAGMAEIQLEYIRIMCDVAKKYGIEKKLFCPTYYRNLDETLSYKGGNEKGGLEYFKVFAASPCMKEVKTFSATYHEPYVTELNKAGRTNFIWWYNFNGCGYSAIPGRLWPGFSDLEWGWDNTAYGHIIPDKIVDVLPDTTASMRMIPHLTDSVWFCGDLEIGLWGAFAWRPESWNKKQESLPRRCLVEQLFGDQTYPHYAAIETILRKWIGILYLNMPIPENERSIILKTDILSMKKHLGEILRTSQGISYGQNVRKQYLNKIQKSIDFLISQEK